MDFDIPDADVPETGACFDLLVTGVGGTGVITVGQLITMAAHLEGKGASVLDFMGFAQKFGPVLSYIRIAADRKQIHQVRIEPSRADALIGCDLVVSSSPKASVTYDPERTRAVVNSAEMATGDFVRQRDASLRAPERLTALESALRETATIDANDMARQLLGDSIFANVLLLGYAWQKGLIPVSRAALERAIELNAVAVDTNKRAFDWGRLAAHDPSRIETSLQQDGSDETLDEAIARRSQFLKQYQNESLATRYESLLARVRSAESSIGDDERLSAAVMRGYFRLLSYKDEYEVARLHTTTEFIDSIRRQYGERVRLTFHMAPPLLNRGTDARGRPRKREFGAWIVPLLRLLARMRGLRGTPFDVFGRTAERRMERSLIAEFESLIEDFLDNPTAELAASTSHIADMYLDIRGYGPVKEAGGQRGSATGCRGKTRRHAGRNLNAIVPPLAHEHCL